MRNVLHIFITICIINFICVSTLRERGANMKVRINAMGDTIVLKFVRPHTDTKLQGYILGYGSSMFSKQFIQLPENGEPYETVIDAEPKYLIAVKHVNAKEAKKQCTEKVTMEKPLHVVIGSVTPTSVLLSWGTLLKTPYTDTNMDDCIDEGQFTVRYREKEPSKQWNYQTCPSTSTVIDNLRPDTPYEFGVRADVDNGSGPWSPPVIHNPADLDIHKLLEPKDHLSPQKPIDKAAEVFLPPVRVLHNITHSRPPPIVRYTRPPPIPRRTLGTGSEDIPSAPSEDPLSLTQNLTFIHTPMSQLPLEATNAFQPPKTTTSPLSSTTQYHTTQSTTITAKTLLFTENQPSTTSIQLSTTLSSTIKSHPSTTEIVSRKINIPHSTNYPKPPTGKTKLHKTDQLQPTITQPQTSKTQPQPGTTQPQPSTTQPQPGTTQPQPSTTQPQPGTTQPQPGTTQPQPGTTQPQPSTTQPQPSTTQPQPGTTQPQPGTTQPQPGTTQPQPGTTQPQPGTTQPQPGTTQPQPGTTQPQPGTTQPQPGTTQPQPGTTQPQLMTTQPTPKTTHPQLSTTQPEPKKTLSQNIPTQPHTVQQPVTSKFHLMTTQPKPTTTPITPQKPRTSQSRKKQEKSTTALPRTTTTQQQIPIQHTSQPKSTHESNTYYQFSTTPKPQQTLSINPLPATLNKDHFFTSTPLTLPRPSAGTQKPAVSQHPAYPIYPTYDTKDTLSSVRNTGSYMHSTTEIDTKPGTQPQRSTTLQPVTAQDKQPASSTIQYYTITQNHDKTESTPKSQPQVTNGPRSPTKHVPEVPRQPFDSVKKLTPTPKSNVKQNSPWAEKQAEAVNNELPGSTAAPSQSQDGQPLPKPAHVRKLTNRTQGPGILRNLSSSTPVMRTASRTTTRNGIPRRRVPLPKQAEGHSGEKHKGLMVPKPTKRPRKTNGSHMNLSSGTHIKKMPNQVEKPADKEKVPDLKQVDSLVVLKPKPTPAPEKPIYRSPPPSTTPLLAHNGSHFYSGDNSSVFSPVPVSEWDVTGKKRFVGPHVMYKTDKLPEEPCSVTHSLSYFPDEEGGDISVTGPPKTPPSNLTVVTVEGCPSFVILDWDKTDNETTEYEVTSSTKGPHGKEVSVLTTNQTHTAVENLKPESSYEFTVTPKNELGTGPASEPVTFSTESADPRVSELPTGKNAIWSSFPFKADSYSECNGRQFVKRTWYRKFVGIQLCNSLRYKIYLSDSLKGKFYNIGDQTGYGEDHCQFVDSFLDGRTGGPLHPNQLPPREGFFRAVRQEPVHFGEIGGSSHINYVAWYECGVPIPGSW